MSVSLTEAAVVARRKTVTRRKGWTFLRPGDRLTLCRKVMGRKPGEPLVRLAEVEVVDVRRESILAMTDQDVWAEGVSMFDAPGHRRFDEWYDDTGLPTVSAWITWWLWEVAPRGFNPYTDDITRIEWRYL